MSIRKFTLMPKLTLFYLPLVVIASVAVGMVIASRLDLSPASSVLRDAGYGERILHRTGHSLGESVHGNGVNMDDYETHDDRRLLAGSGFTIEPGVYFDDFGVRTEINMIVAPRDAAVTGPLQTVILGLV